MQTVILNEEMEIKTYTLILLIGISFIQSVNGQIEHSKYFEVSTEDINRWEMYTNLLNQSDLALNQVADSILKFAQIEYELGQFSKARELSFLAQEYNPELTSIHLLIGKAYVSSAQICQGDDSHKIKEDIIWAAIDEWEKVDSNSIDYEESRKLIKIYSRYLPTEEHFRNCFGSKKVKKGDEYFVGCWINRKTKIRLRNDG